MPAIDDKRHERVLFDIADPAQAAIYFGFRVDRSK
jgi:hypothetical protein